MLHKWISFLLLLPAFAMATAADHTAIRVATPWPAQNTIIAMLGYAENIVGTSAVAKRIPLFREVYPAIDKVPAISVNSAHELNAEQIVALRAQLLIVPENTRLPQALTHANILILALPGNSLAALRKRVTLTAQALGPDARIRAQRYQRYFQRNISLIQQRLADLPAAGRVRLYHSMSSTLITSGRPSLNQDWMDLAGARNIAETWFTARPNAAGEVPLEKIIAADPQVVVAMNPRDAQIIRRHPAWQNTAAVRRQRVYVNPRGLFWWCRETSEEALQILWLAKTLYPQRFADIDMAEETRAFYQDFFNLTLTSRQIATILRPPIP